MADPEVILRLRLIERLSLRAIGLKVGLSGERVRKILLDHNVDASHTAKRVSRREAKRDPKRRPLDAKQVQAIYGCDVDTLWSIQGHRPLSDSASPAHVYREQRKHYLRRDLWAFTFQDWWSLWQVRWPSRKAESLILVPKNPARKFGLGNAQILTRGEHMKRHWAKRRGTDTP
jgi:hypothetical protein